MTDTTIPFGRPQLGQEEIDAVVEVLRGPQLVHGPMAAQFETAFAERIGTAHAISVSSCTAGLHLSLLAEGVGPGDEVLVPAMTHVATAHAVEYCGARPIFVDVAPQSGNIDPGGFAAALGGKSRAAIVVHYLGLPCDMGPLMDAASGHGIFVVEDCALSVDATYDGVKTGAIGLTGCFSFYPVKHITTAEGGMVTTDDDRLAGLLRQRKAFGYDRSLGERTKPGIYDVTLLGYNYRMSEVHAAIGLTQLGKLDDFQRARARNFSELKDALEELDEVTVMQPRQGKASSSHYCLNAVLPRDGSIDRDAVAAYLKAKGVGTSVHYPSAVPLFEYYRAKYGHRPGEFPVAEWLAAQTVSLPVGPHLGEGDAPRIARHLKDAVREARRG